MYMCVSMYVSMHNIPFLVEYGLLVPAQIRSPEQNREDPDAARRRSRLPSHVLAWQLPAHGRVHAQQVPALPRFHPVSRTG